MSDLGDFTNFEGDDSSADGGDAEDAGETPPASAADDSPETTDDEQFRTFEATPAGSDHGIGVLSASEGLRIDEEPDETRLRAYVTVGNRRDVRIGSYLIAPYPDDERLFCRITGLEYAQEYRADDATEIHARRAMRAEGIDEEDFKLMATLEPVA